MRNSSQVYLVVAAFMILLSTIEGASTVGKRHNHQTSFPYLTGDTFREFCDHVLDPNNKKFNPSLVLPGDTIFVATHQAQRFFEKISPKITHSYILVTHNADRAVPGESIKYLKDENLLAWFGQNARSSLDSKLFHIPIGLANSHWRHGNISIVKRVQAKKTKKKHLMYMNFSPGTNKDIRTKVYNLFHEKKYCYCRSKISFEAYLTDLAESKFVLSPPGNGEDCHRTWEALYMGAIPIVQTSFLDPMFENLPVLIIDDWSKVDEDFLEQAYKEMSNKEYNLDKLYVPYWFEIIRNMQNTVREKL